MTTRKGTGIWRSERIRRRLLWSGHDSLYIAVGHRRLRIMKRGGHERPTGVSMTRAQHREAVYIVGTDTRGKVFGLILVCHGPDCGGAEMFARPTVGDTVAKVEAHIDEMGAVEHG